MRKNFLLVDGYNIINAWPELKELMEVSMESARQKLLDIMTNYQGFKNITVIVVFDAHMVKGGRGSDFKYNNINVIFTKEAQTADNYIERVVTKLPEDYRVRVATSDGLEQTIIMGHGAIRMSARELKREITYTEKHIRTEYIQKRPAKNNMLMDNLDPQTAQMLEQMRYHKGRWLLGK